MSTWLPLLTGGSTLVLGVVLVAMARAARRRVGEAGAITRHLEEQNTRLLQLAGFKDEMSELLVHDLKNPLAVIATNLDFVADDFGEGPVEVAEALDGAKLAIRRMHRIISNLLDISRLEEKRMVLRRGTIHAADLLRSVSEQRAMSARTKKVSFVVDAVRDLRLDVDVDLVTRVIENLLDNALRYTPPEGRIFLGATRAEGIVCLRIGNTGPPIPPHKREVVFEKFGQLTHTGYRTNLGLGLYFCRLAIEAHSGRMWVAESPELPTLFCIDLPQGAAGA